MKISGDRRQLCIGGWLVAALVLIALNGFTFLDLESRPLKGNSPAIKTLRLKLGRLESALAGSLSNGIGQDDFQTVFAVYRRPQQPDAVGAPKSMDEGNSADQASDQVMLPALKGIIRVMNQNGGPDYIAVLDGLVCRKKDRVKDFVVGEITAAGVVLHRSGNRWLIHSPAPSYSNDQGN